MVDNFDRVTRGCASGGTQTYSATLLAWSACPTTWNCTSAPTHDGCVSASTYPSCKAIKLDATFTGTDGNYSLDPDGAGGSAPVLAYCFMSKGAGGWTLALNIDTGDGNFLEWGNTAFRTSTSSGYGTVGAHLTSDFKSLEVFKSLSATQILVMAHEEGAVRAWKSWTLANAGTPSTFWSGGFSTLTTSMISSENDQTLATYEPIVKPSGQLIVNRQYGAAGSLDRARLGNNQSWGFTNYTSGNADNVLDGLGLDMDLNNGSPGSWWDAGSGYDNVSYAKALMGTDELPGAPWATTNSRGLHYDYAIFVK